MLRVYHSIQHNDGVTGHFIAHKYYVNFLRWFTANLLVTETAK